jgi:DNA-binding NarL/FixJ family response regulator
MKLLVVDKAAPLMARLASAAGEIDGVTVVGKARHARTALEEARRLEPDVVILDVRLPGGSGVSLLEAIKQEMPQIIVIIFSSDGASQYRERCALGGADYFFEKNSQCRLFLATLARLSANKVREAA